MPVGGAEVRLLPGPGSFPFGGRRGVGSPIRVRYYLPAVPPDAAPVVFVMSGVKRDADVYRDTWSAAAERFGFLLLCPEFPRADYPRAAYQLGNLVDGAKRPRPASRWTFGIVEDLFDAVRGATGNPEPHYSIYGHSAGAQFVHRMVLFVPDGRYRVAVAANAGWYTMPTFAGARFPYGLRRSPGTPETLRRALGRRLVVLLGDRDTDAEDPHLRNSPGAVRQGRNRLDRGRSFYAAARAEAAGLGTPFDWTLRTVPGAGHFDHQMVPSAAPLLSAGGG